MLKAAQHIHEETAIMTVCKDVKGICCFDSICSLLGVI